MSRRNGGGDRQDERHDFAPLTPTLNFDTDGDGYWDGWIGVYGVGRTDDVVLYMEHLVDKDDPPGVSGHEIVQEQVETHTWNGEERSKLHVGELHWKHFDASQPGDSTDPNVTPNPTLQVEVDYYAGADSTALSVLDDVERNYALYGLEVTFDVDQKLTDDDLDSVFVPSERQGPRSISGRRPRSGTPLPSRRRSMTTRRSSTSSSQAMATRILASLFPIGP